MTTRALYVTATGALVSIGTVLAGNLPGNLTAATLTDTDAAALLTGYASWDPTTRAVTPRDYGTDKADLAALGAVVLASPSLLAQVQATILAAKGATDGAAWVQPQGAHDAYPLGQTVTYDGKTWESLIAANVWAPGVSGWREVAVAPAWVQPTGAGDAYQIGNRVTFEGHIYESKINANVWSPTAYPAGWQLIS